MLPKAGSFESCTAIFNKELTKSNEGYSLIQFQVKP